MRRASAGASLTVLSLLFCRPACSQDGLLLFHKMQNALGGSRKIAAIRDFEQSVRAESWNGNTGQSLGEVRKSTRWIRPNYLRADQVRPGSTYLLYLTLDTTYSFPKSNHWIDARSSTCGNKTGQSRPRGMRDTTVTVAR